MQIPRFNRHLNKNKKVRRRKKGGISHQRSVRVRFSLSLSFCRFLRQTRSGAHRKKGHSDEKMMISQREEGVEEALLELGYKTLNFYA